MAVVAIGDVVGSREVADQRRLLRGVAAAVAGLEGARSAAATVGDEFQAIYDDLPTAIGSLASLRLRLLDEPPADDPVEVRIGIGVGDIVGVGDVVGSEPDDVVGSEPDDAGAPGQSGPGWWHAREALEAIAAPRRAWPTVRWWVVGDGPLAPVRATLVALDTIAARFDATDVSLARGLLAGTPARRLAAAHGITPQSVGQRLRDHGVYGWVRTLQTLTGEDR